MDQSKSGGHHAITQVAVNMLFEGAGANAAILGLNQNAFYKQLDRWQEHADRFLGGDTWHPSRFDPDAQRRHSMADPSKTGAQNLRDISAFITGNLYLAHIAHSQGKTELEWQYLGAAVHALEDSYSSAHVFRDPNNPSDPHARVEALNNFSPGGRDQTHDRLFDKVKFDEVMFASGRLERGSDQAAAVAVAEALSTYMNQVSSDPQQAYAAFAEVVSQFFQGQDVHVLTDRNAQEFQDQLRAHYQNEACDVRPMSATADNLGEGSLIGTAYDPSGVTSFIPTEDAGGTGVELMTDQSAIMSIEPALNGGDITYDPANMVDINPVMSGDHDGMSIDPAYDPAGIMSIDPGYDVHGATSYDPAHDGGMSIDPAYDPAGIMSINAPHGGDMSIDPGYDPHGATSFDPAHDGGMSVDPAYDPAGIMSIDPAYDGGMSIDPGHDVHGGMSYDPAHDGGMSVDPGHDVHGGMNYDPAHDGGMSIDHAHDAHGAMSYDPAHDGGMSFDPGHDAHGGMSYDPAYDGGISVDPGHDAHGAMSYDPSHDGGVSIDPGHDAHGAMSYDPAHDGGMSVDPGHEAHGATAHDSGGVSGDGGHDAAAVNVDPGY